MANETMKMYELSDEEFKTLAEMAIRATKGAYCPYSNFRVGACVLITPPAPQSFPSATQSSTTPPQLFFTGANVEIVSTPVGICAERTALSGVIASFPRPYMPTIRAIGVSSDVQPPATPCGMCRQFIAEFAERGVGVYMFGSGAEQAGEETGATVGDGEEVRMGYKFIHKTVGELLPWGFTRSAEVDGIMVSRGS